MEAGSQRRLAAIVFADVVGYSRLMSADEVGTLAALRAHRSGLIDPLIAQHGGRIVKTMGDGLLLEFPSVVDAVSCSLELQKGIVGRNAGIADEEALRFRIGIHLGDVIVEGDDIFGDGVNVASRIEALADPDGIALSDDAYRQVRDRMDIAWRDSGEHRVKNIPRAVSVWSWTPGADARRAETDRAASSPVSGPSIAVLPFDNLSGDPEQEYFADGVCEDVITELSKIPGLMVISRNSTFTYKGKPARAQDVCRDLGVAHVLEGSVRKAGERVRITAQLIDGGSGGHLWAERYDRDLGDIFAVQDDVTQRIVQALEVTLVDDTGPAQARVETEIPEAYDCVLRGREKFRLYTREGNQSARQLYERAIELDPDYAAAHAGLALVFMHEWFQGTPDALDRAYAVALKAAALDPSLPLVYEALGNVRLFRRQYDEAVATARQWVRIEPGNADAYANLAGALHFSGQHQEVLPLIEKAILLNPFYPFYYILYRGQALMAMERYGEALVWIRRSVVRNPDALPPHLYLAACNGLLGDSAAAGEAFAEVLRLHPEVSADWVRTYFAYKNPADADRLIAGLVEAGLSG